VPCARPGLTARYRVGQAVVPVEAGPDGDAAGIDAAGVDAAAVARGERAAAGAEVAAAAAVEAADDALAGLVLAVAGAEDGAEFVHPATLIAATTAVAAAAVTPARRADLVEPNIPDLFPRPRRRS
jgi:hypothetical protein